MNKVLNYLNYKNGFFIETGANDGIDQSYTYGLEKNGWLGILIEPNANKLQEAMRNRPGLIYENYALVDSLYDKNTIKGTFNYTDRGNSLSAMITENNFLFTDDEISKHRSARENNSVEVPAISLKKILKKYNITEVDFFSLDVEGYEINVLDGLDLNINRPKYILIETWENTERDFNLISYMNKNFYTDIGMIDNNRLFYYKT